MGHCCTARADVDKKGQAVNSVEKKEQQEQDHHACRTSTAHLCSRVPGAGQINRSIYILHILSDLWIREPD